MAVIAHMLAYAEKLFNCYQYSSPNHTLAGDYPATNSMNVILATMKVAMLISNVTAAHICCSLGCIRINQLLAGATR